MSNKSSLESVLQKLADVTEIDLTDKDELLKKFIYFCCHSIPADKELKPKMVALLRALHRSDMRLNQWYFQLQECIKNYYRAQGSSFFFEDAKDILKGTKEFDTEDAMEHLVDRLRRCVKMPGPHGTNCYL
jgi:hypothetical protein